MNKSYYAIIPANVRYDEDLKPNAKLLYGELTALSNEKGYCWANNSYFAKLYNVTTKTISVWISQLNNKGYINSELIYEGNTKIVLERRISIVINPIVKKIEKVSRKKGGGYPEKKGEGIPKKVKDNSKVNNTINNTTTDKNETNVVVDIFTITSFYDRIKNKIGVAVSKKAIEEMIQKKGETEINKYIDNWDKFSGTKKKTVAGFFKNAVMDSYVIPKEDVDKSNCGNFEQRKYSDEFYESLYENGGSE